MRQTILITGGAGFIGSNTADYFLKKKYTVNVFDDLSRRGSDQNLAWLRRSWGSAVTFIKGDVVRDKTILRKLAEKSDAVIHLAAQVAVTTSVQQPYRDFLVNTQGTLNVLEAVRRSQKKPLVIYSSTNKVHGNLEGVAVAMTERGYRYPSLQYGVAETHRLDFHSPYGCSKGAADQYVRDYARIYGLRTVVFRQSCIYGPHQFGIEDQGWVAWFVIATLLGKPITIYGDGHQVRDVLYIEDLNRLYEVAIKKIDRIQGKIYNIGGGAHQAFSLLQTLALLEKIFKKKISYACADWRPGDQKVYISDIRKVEAELGWKPKVDFEKGLRSLVRWASAHETLLQKFVA